MCLTSVDGRPALTVDAPNNALTREHDVQCICVLGPNWVLTAGLAAALPRQGLDAPVPGCAQH